MASGTVAELMENSVAVRLLHLGVDVEARVAQFRDLFRKELHPCSMPKATGTNCRRNNIIMKISQKAKKLLHFFFDQNRWHLKVRQVENTLSIWYYNTQHEKFFHRLNQQVGEKMPNFAYQGR